MSPRSLSLAGKIWSDVIGSAGSRIAGANAIARVAGARNRTPYGSGHQRTFTTACSSLPIRKNRAQQHLATDASKPRRAAELAEAGYLVYAFEI